MPELLAFGALAGLCFGIFFHKGRICYASALSDLFLFRSSRTGSGILLATLLTMLSWSVIRAVRGDVGFWIPSWGWYGLVGGVVFGIGMVVAGACITSTFWRVASGNGDYLLTLLGIATGFVLYALVQPIIIDWYFTPLWLGPGVSAYDRVGTSPPLVAMGVAAVAVFVYVTFVGDNARRYGGEMAESRGDRSLVRSIRPTVTLGAHQVRAGVTVYVDSLRSGRSVGALLRGYWDPRPCGIGIAATATLWAVGYGVWTVSTPSAQWLGFVAGIAEPATWLVAPGLAGGFPLDRPTISPAMGVIAGFFVGSFLSSIASGDFGFTAPNSRTAPASVVGGVLMGLGSRLAPGCNVSNLYTGLAQLSVHSVLASVGIVVGAYLATRLLFNPVR